MHTEEGLFPMAYAGSVRYYAAMFACRMQLIHCGKIDRRLPWCANHCRIVGANGEQTLTIPLLKPTNGRPETYSGMAISEHGDWRRVHWGALFSAYGKAPFFEYIADDLQAIYENRDITNLIDFNKALDALIIDFLDLPLNCRYDGKPGGNALSSDGESQSESEDAQSSFRSIILDFSYEFTGAGRDNIAWIKDIPYWQVWQERHGFRPDLSIFDLLMTHGRESVFILEQAIR